MVDALTRNVLFVVVAASETEMVCKITGNVDSLCLCAIDALNP